MKGCAVELKVSDWQVANEHVDFVGLRYCKAYIGL